MALDLTQPYQTYSDDVGNILISQGGLLYRNDAASGYPLVSPAPDTQGPSEWAQLTATQAAAVQAFIAATVDPLSVVRSSGYHFHGWAPNQQADLKFWDYSGALNDGNFQTNLDAATAYATANFITQPNPTIASNQSLIALPALSWDWSAGDSLFIFWRGRATPEGADAPLLGDTSGTAANGFRVIVSSSGKLKVNLYQQSGALSRFSGTGTSTVFETSVTHSTAFIVCPSGLAFWSDGVRGTTYASGYIMPSGGAVSTVNATTLKLGGDGGTTASVQNGVACQTQSLVILKGRRAASAPSAAASSNRITTPD